MNPLIEKFRKFKYRAPFVKYVDFTVRDLKYRLFELIPALRERPEQTAEALTLDLHPGRWY